MNTSNSQRAMHAGITPSQKPVYTIHVDRADDYDDIEYIHPESFSELERAKEIMQELIDEANASLSVKYGVEEFSDLCWRRYSDGEYSSDHIQIQILETYLDVSHNRDDDDRVPHGK